MNDLRLLISISNYSALNFGVAEAAKKAFQRHLWYLTEELAPLAFFTHDVDESTKEELRVTLLNQKYLLPEISKRHGSGFGKPTFPDMNDLPQQNLSELFGRESWQFFTILGIDTEFLFSPVSSWSSMESFRQAKDVVQALHVVNDAAERGVKLCHDFILSSKKEQKLQGILQVVENSRARLPDQRKLATADGGDKKWYLKLC